jgi:hypothetical protein
MLEQLLSIMELDSERTYTIGVEEETFQNGELGGSDFE